MFMKKSGMKKARITRPGAFTRKISSLMRKMIAFCCISLATEFYHFFRIHLHGLSPRICGWRQGFAENDISWKLKLCHGILRNRLSIGFMHHRYVWCIRAVIWPKMNPKTFYFVATRKDLRKIRLLLLFIDPEFSGSNFLTDSNKTRRKTFRWQNLGNH